MKSVKNIETALKNPVDKIDSSGFCELKNIFEKSLAVNKDLPGGHVLTFEDMEAKKPKGYGIAAEDFKKIIGKKIKKDLRKWSFLNSSDIS